ncbi:hypothetical protein SMSP2_02471 [Limihaloglobus sulfuriphilus]|uniref:Uncharacterized protein n=1 Tax=Limihaloglobus sulfuriphilus TaxID=1851148 RepID=A0A1Q2MHC0_9BACT|nr:hypothetical protein SMSP2_02471 [Limihaloglobus sulfuriphilus]
MVDDGGVVKYYYNGNPKLWDDREGDKVFWPIPKKKEIM